MRFAITVYWLDPTARHGVMWESFNSMLEFAKWCQKNPGITIQDVRETLIWHERGPSDIRD